MEIDIHKLAVWIALALGFPIVIYLTGVAWNKTLGAPRKLNKAWATFCLVLPIAALGMLVQPSTYAVFGQPRLDA
jgi:hypothetical protein